MAVNPLLHFLASHAGSPVIAVYQSLNQLNGHTNNFYIIRTDRFLIELSRLEGQMHVEFRSVYDLEVKHLITYSIFPDRHMLHYQVTPFDAYFKSNPRIEKMMDESGREVLTVFDGDTEKYRLTLSDGIPNLHHSALFIQEATSLPAQIAYENIRHTFHSILTDETQKREILDSLKIDLDKYMVLDQSDLEQLTQKMFGVSYDEMVDVFERVKGEKGKGDEFF